MACNTCAVCENVFGDLDLVACGLCCTIFHQSCVKLTATEIRVLELKSKKSLQYLCKECKDFGGKHTLKSSLEELTEKVENYQAKIQNIDTLATTIEKLVDSVSTLYNQVNDLKSSETEKMLMNYFDAFQAEARLRSIKEKNVVLLGVPDNNDSQEDFHTISEYISLIPDVTQDDFLVKRTGAPYNGEISIYFFNAGGMRSKDKLQQFRKGFNDLTLKPEIIIITETWFNNSIYDGELGLDNYMLFKSNRPYDETVSRGGGVLVAVHSSIKSYEITVAKLHKNSNHLFISCIINNASYIIGATYIQPSSDVSVYEAHTNVIYDISEKYPLHKILLFGDYNLPNVIWKKSLPKIINYLDPNYVQSMDIMAATFSYLDLVQLIPVLESKGYTLDLLFTNVEEIRIQQPEEYLLKTDQNHEAYMIYIKVNMNLNEEENTVKYKNFFRANYTLINNYLQQIDWNGIFLGLNFAQMIELFYDKIKEIINLYVPITSDKKNLVCYPHWYSLELINLTKEKRFIHYKWKSIKEEKYHIQFKKLRAQCIRLSRITYKKYIDTIEKNCKINIKAFWSHVNMSKQTKSNIIPTNLYYKDNCSNNLNDGINLFKNHFESVYIHDSFRDVDSYNLMLNSKIDEKFLISSLEVNFAINKLKNNCGSGPDGIHAFFVKNCKDYLILPLQLLFNKSLCDGIMPSIWKSSYITPIHKNGDKCNVENYRPIAIINSFAKIFESIITNKIMEHYSNLICKEQHGYIPGKSTITNLLIYSDFIASSLDKMLQVDVVYTDFSKAFDKVSHQKLIEKLIKYKLDLGLIKWIHSYLTERKIVIRYKNYMSQTIDVTSSVPQGSHLGPILFCFFINDLIDNLTFVNCLLYADDLKIYATVIDSADSIKFQRDLDLISLWSKDNLIPFNLQKCCTISFSRGKNKLVNDYFLCDEVLKTTKTIKDLGILFNDNFDFSDHVRYVNSKAFRVFGFIRRFASDFKVSTIVYLYNILVKPYFLYASMIWSPYQGYVIKNLESVQKKFIRYLSFKLGKPMTYLDHDYNETAYLLKIPTIISLHNYYDLLFVFKIINNKINCEAINDRFQIREYQHNVRNCRLLVEDSSKSKQNFYYFSSITRMKRDFNKIPSSVNKNNAVIFKKEISKLYLNYYN